MPINAKAAFDPTFGQYRVRLWASGNLDNGWNTIRKVPDDYWHELGIIPSPSKQNDRFDKLAQKWGEREAVRVEKELRQKPKAVKKTLLEAWEIYKAENPDKVQPATITRNEINAKNVKAFLEEKRLLDLLPEDVDIVLATRYRNWREDREEKVSPRTIWNELAWLKQLCNFAYAWQSATGSDAVRLVKLPYLEMPENDGVALTEDEFGRVLEKVQDRDREIMTAGVTTRLRRRNLLGLRGEWFDRGERWLHIPAPFMKGVRGAKKPLSVPVATWTLDIVGERASGLLWPSEKTGDAMVWYEHVLTKAIAQSGVRPFSLHDLRTTGNSWLDRAGVDKMTRRVLMGHSTKTGDVTDLYTKKFVEQLREGVAVYDEIRKRNGW
jgi:integrase